MLMAGRQTALLKDTTAETMPSLPTSPGTSTCQSTLTYLDEVARATRRWVRNDLAI